MPPSSDGAEQQEPGAASQDAPEQGWSFTCQRDSERDVGMFV